MNPSLSFFLRAKHWHLFLLLIGAVALQQMQIPFLVVTLTFIVGFQAWLWTLGRFLWSTVPHHLRLNMPRFRFSLAYPILFVMLFTVVAPGARLPLWLIPLNLLAMICMFYNIYFVAKSLRLAELQKPLGLSKYWGPFLLILYFPIGIWFLQPRVNQLYARHRDAEPIAPPVA